LIRGGAKKLPLWLEKAAPLFRGAVSLLTEGYVTEGYGCLKEIKRDAKIAPLYIIAKV